jgi:hypothetical protein
MKLEEPIFKLLLSIIKNIKNFPKEEKYQKLKKENIKLKNIIENQYSNYILKDIGFEDFEEYFILNKNFDIKHLNNVLENLEEIKKIEEKNIYFFDESYDDEFGFLSNYFEFSFFYNE